MTIDFYKEYGELGYLASYSSHGFYKDGIFYKTVEHYYQSEKFDDIETRNRIINCNTPKEASTIGRSRDLVRKDNFKSFKNSVMYDGVLEKFRQNKDIRSKLIETGNKEIREMTIKESYWGVGPDLKGENNIGKILVKVREQVKTELLDEIINKSKGQTVYVVGHKNPDVDSIVSSLVLCEVLKSFGIDARFGIREGSIIDKALVDEYVMDNYEVINNTIDKKFILVDTNSLDGISSSQVIGAIDHHMITGEVEDLIEIEYASCALLIYDLFKDRFEFNKYLKDLIALSVICDTMYLTSSRFGEYDKKIFEELGSNYDVDYLKHKYLTTTDFDLDISYNLKSDYKEYHYNDRFIRRSMINSYTDEFNEYYNLYTSHMDINGIDLLIWCDFDKKVTYYNYLGENYVFPFFTTSSMLIIKYLDNMLLKPRVLEKV